MHVDDPQEGETQVHEQAQTNKQTNGRASGGNDVILWWFASVEAAEGC